MRPYSFNDVARWIHFILRRRITICILVLLSVLAYCRTIDVTPYFDDNPYVFNNTLLQDVGNYFQEAPKPKDMLEDVYNNFRLRPLAYFSFSINYLLDGTSVTGYHLVNIIVHTLNGLLVYLLVVTLFHLLLKKHDLSSDDSIDIQVRSIALFTSALFVVHPIMTNAVTYITQRITSLSALFYLLAVVLYGRYLMRTEAGETRKPLYIMALVSTCAAMLTKEIALTIPIMLAAVDVGFGTATTRRRIARLAPFAATMGIVPSLAMSLRHSETVDANNKFITAINLVNFTGTSPIEYFLTQLKVIVRYVSMLLYPAGLSIEHHFPLSHSIMDPGVPSAVILHLVAAGSAVWLLVKFRKPLDFPAMTRFIAGFGILWFYLTLSVESSFIPITETMVEHRLYLPATGFLLFSVCTIHWAAGRYRTNVAYPATFCFLTLAVAIMMVATITRNEVWRDPEIFWKQTIRQYPYLGRPYANLADFYLEQERRQEAIQVYLQAIDCIPDLYFLHYDLGNIYIETGQFEQAANELREAIALAPEKEDTYRCLAKAKCYQGAFVEAQQILGRALTANRCSEIKK